MKEIKLYEISPPRKWGAGKINGIEKFFDCGECGAKEPGIYGFLGYSQPFDEIAVIENKKGRCLALLCENCYKNCLEKERAGG